MNSESIKSSCPKCGRPLPVEASQGLCPQCLLVAAATATEADQPTAGSPPPPSLEVVAAMFPQLEILELIGQGGMGAVYKARQPKLDRFVAIKLLTRPPDAAGAFAERFRREARVLAKLNHPGIVSVYDYGEAGGFFYLLMEFVDGVNLRQAMQAGRFTPSQALAVVPKICEALQFAHDEGILHRDIKPENILLDTRGRVKIADFGIAKLIGDKAKDPTLTASGLAVGTPLYMAPEQLEHPQDVDQRADIYSLGVVFYEMLTGELPIGRFAPPSAKTPVDPRVDEVVLRALEKERERRQHNAFEVKTEVEQITANPLVPPQPVRLEPASPDRRSRPGEDESVEKMPAVVVPLWAQRWLAAPTRLRRAARITVGIAAAVLAICFGSYTMTDSSDGGRGGRDWSVGAFQPWLKSWHQDASRGFQSGIAFNVVTVSFACGIGALLLCSLAIALHRIESRRQPLPGGPQPDGEDLPGISPASGFGPAGTVVLPTRSRAAVSQARPALGSRAACYMSTPKKMRRCVSGASTSLFLCDGELRLDAEELVFVSSSRRTLSIPLQNLQEFSLGLFRMWNTPGLGRKYERLNYLAVTCLENGQPRTVLFTPVPTGATSAIEINAFVAEWFDAIQAAIVARTGTAPRAAAPRVTSLSLQPAWTRALTSWLVTGVVCVVGDVWLFGRPWHGVTNFLLAGVSGASAVMITLLSLGFFNTNQALKRGDLEAVTSDDPPAWLQQAGPTGPGGRSPAADAASLPSATQAGSVPTRDGPSRPLVS